MVFDISSPMKKLEFMYQIFHTIMIHEIDLFWKGIPIERKKLEIDYGNLIGIAIYTVLKSSM